MLKVGQVIMYHRSVCVVCDIVEDYHDKGTFYKLTPLYDDTLTIHAPVDCPDGVFKPLLTKDQIETLITKIPSISCVDTSDRMLDTIYKELFSSEKHEDLIRIIKTTYMRIEDKVQKGQRRTEKDKIYFQKAEKALYGELAASLGKTINETREYIVERVDALNR